MVPSRDDRGIHPVQPTDGSGRFARPLSSASMRVENAISLGACAGPPTNRLWQGAKIRHS